MKQHTKIAIAEEVRHWNALVETADLSLAFAADDVTSPRKLYSLLNVAGHHSLAASLREAGSALGYFGNDRPRDPGECSAEACVCETKTKDLEHKISAKIGALIELYRVRVDAADAIRSHYGSQVGDGIIIELQHVIRDLKNLNQ